LESMRDQLIPVALLTKYRGASPPWPPRGDAPTTPVKMRPPIELVPGVNGGRRGFPPIAP
jgi:hypothetical protein